MINVLFVCLGNICRSPLAEGIFKNLLKETGFDLQISCDSAGTSGWHIGSPPDKRSIAIAKKYGIELDHFGRQIEEEDFRDFDYIIAMDASNFQNIQAESGHNGFPSENLMLMRAFDGRGKNLDVPDPYFGGPEGFQEVYEMLKRSCNNFLNYIIEKHNLT